MFFCLAGEAKSIAEHIDEEYTDGQRDRELVKQEDDQYFRQVEQYIAEGADGQIGMIGHSYAGGGLFGPRSQPQLFRIGAVQTIFIMQTGGGVTVPILPGKIPGPVCYPV